MTIYIDLYFLLNFLLDLITLFVCRRVLGYHRPFWRILLAAVLGALYSIAALYLQSPGFILLHLAFGVLLLLIALGFGNLRRFLRLCMLFFGVCFLLGGAVTALTRGMQRFRNGDAGQLGICIVLAAALLGALLCLFWARNTQRTGRVVPVSLRTENEVLSFQGYADTGNLLRDPVENIPVILANAALSKRIFSLFSKSAPPASVVFDPDAYRGMPLRLVPCDTVAGRVLLPALRFSDASIDGVHRAVCVALDFKRAGDYCGFEALVPAEM